MMQAATELNLISSDGSVMLTTVTVAARAAPGGATGAGDDRPRRPARRFRKDMTRLTEGSRLQLA